MRKLIISMILAFIVFTFGSCEYGNMPDNGSESDSVQGEKNVYEKIGKERWDWDDSEGDECALKVIDCFINKDSETLKEMFCSKAKNNPDFDEQIDEAFEFIKGNIISYDDYIACASSSSYREGKLVKAHYSPIIEDIKTDVGKTYRINVSLYAVYDKDEGKVGITSLTVRENEDSAYRLGLPPN